MLGRRHGGIGRYVLELSKSLLEIDRVNHYDIFVNLKTSDAADVDQLRKFENATVVPANIRHYSLGEQLSFARLLNKYPLDIVHFPNFNVALNYQKPFVVTIHDMVHHKIGGAKKSHFPHFLAYKKVIESAAEKSKKIITVSQAAKKDIASFLRIPPNKIAVTYEGSKLNTKVSSEQVAEIKKRYFLDKPYFLFVGVLERKKNLVNLTRGFDQFFQKYNIDMDLVVVGKTDPHYPEIKHEALDIKHNDRLVFTGQVEDSELTALYKGAYAFASASVHEGFGLPGVEALGFGLPLLASNSDVFNEIYDNAAVYFNPFDPEDIAEKMHLLAQDKQFYQQLRGKSLQRSLLFDWRKTAEETLEVYRICVF